MNQTCNEECECSEAITEERSEENFLIEAQQFWFRFGLFMHFILAYMHAAVMFDMSPELLTNHLGA